MGHALREVKNSDVTPSRNVPGEFSWFIPVHVSCVWFALRVVRPFDQGGSGDTNWSIRLRPALLGSAAGPACHLARQRHSGLCRRAWLRAWPCLHAHTANWPFPGFPQCHAHACADRYGVVAQIKRQAQAIHHAPADAFDLIQLPGFFQNQCELAPCEPANRIGRADESTQAIGGLHQQAVSASRPCRSLTPVNPSRSTYST